MTRGSLTAYDIFALVLGALALYQINLGTDQDIPTRMIVSFSVILFAAIMLGRLRATGRQKN